MPSFAGAWDLFPTAASKPPAGAVLNPRHPLASSVIACWMFNETGGGQAADCSPNNLHATANAASPSSACNMKFTNYCGVHGLLTRFASFGATGSGRFLSKASPLLTPSRFSVELRLFFIGHNVGSSSFFWGCSGGTATTRGVSIDFASPTTVQFRLGTTATTAVTVTNTRPIHFVGTCAGFTGAAGDVKFYVDGLLVQTGTPPAASVFGRSDMSIGARFVSSEATHEACNDLLVCYNRVLTPDEILDRYRRPYAIAALPRMLPRFGVASSPPPPPPAYSGAVLFPCCM